MPQKNWLGNMLQTQLSSGMDTYDFSIYWVFFFLTSLPQVKDYHAKKPFEVSVELFACKTDSSTLMEERATRGIRRFTRYSRLTSSRGNFVHNAAVRDYELGSLKSGLNGLNIAFKDRLCSETENLSAASPWIMNGDVQQYSVPGRAYFGAW